MLTKKMVLTGLLVSGLMACSANPPVSAPAKAPEFTVVNTLHPGDFDPKTNSIYVGDAGHGKKGTDLKFTLNLPQSAFTVKTNGVTQGLAANVNKFRIVLTTSNGASTSPLLAANITTFDSGNLTPTTGFTSGSAKTYTISNLTAAGTFFVGVQLFNNTDNLMKNVSYTVPGPLPLALSAAVTVDTTTTPGIITVSPASVTVAAVLRDGVGGSVDAAVTPTNGIAIGAVSVSNP